MIQFSSIKTVDQLTIYLSRLNLPYALKEIEQIQNLMEKLLSQSISDINVFEKSFVLFLNFFVNSIPS
jgi:hypothetical protein